MIRKLIPAAVKHKIRIAQRQFTDQKSGINRLFVDKNTHASTELSEVITTIEQPIFYNPLSANKVENIQIAIQEIQQVIIPPDAVFSFWHIVGNPTPSKGYKTGRNIIGDQLKKDIGGGLCQVSGMIYHLALVSGMEIIERHNHTLDLYEEAKRYTPLGADATVVFGYKDLRFKNTTSSPIALQFTVTHDRFTGCVKAKEQLPVHDILFEREEFHQKRTINTYRIKESHKEFINLSEYLIKTS